MFWKLVNLSTLKAGFVMFRTQFVMFVDCRLRAYDEMLRAIAQHDIKFPKAARTSQQGP